MSNIKPIVVFSENFLEKELECIEVTTAAKTGLISITFEHNEDDATTVLDLDVRSVKSLIAQLEEAIQRSYENDVQHASHPVYSKFRSVSE